MDQATKNPVKMISRALDYAFRKHQAADAKAGIANPRWASHLAEVGRLLAEVTDGKDQFVVAAGILHDVLEATDCTKEDIERKFGREVARIVAEISIDPTISEAERQRIRLDSSDNRSQRAKFIIVADQISQILAMTSRMTADSNFRKRLEFFNWSNALVGKCRGACAGLGSMYDRAYVAGLDKISNLVAPIEGAPGETLRKSLGEAYRQV